ncbi:MAG: division/cell wall cluster transcriptional repressor MraZ [Actinomycetota bacterium]|nr:division/cell wall cluster transcriptional repressor MraZ [Actinomycetota bacterium]
MFLGEFQHTVDDKNRITLPAKFREPFADGLIMTKGFENCLFVFSKTEWPRIEDKIRSLALLKKDARKLSRFFFGGANEDTPDKNGRVVIPGHLRAFAGLDKDVVVVGVSNRLEIWSKDNWERYVAEAGRSYEDTAEDLADLGL